MQEEKENTEDYLLNEIQQNAEETSFQDFSEEPEAKESQNSFFDEPEKEEPEEGESFFEISGEIAVELIDVAVSRLSSVGFKIAKIPNHYQDFQLSAEEKRTLAPLIEKWLEYERIEMNPRYALLSGLAVIYGLKGFNVIARAKQAKEEGTEEELKKEAPKNKGGRPKGAKDKKPRRTASQKTQEKEAPEKDAKK